MTATDVAATWTGYGLWALLIMAALVGGAALLVAASQGIYTHLANAWTLRHKGHLGAVHEILQDPQRSSIQKVNEAFAMTRHGLKGTGWTANEVEHGRACPACGTQLRRKRPTQPVPPLQILTSAKKEAIPGYVWCDKYEGVRMLGHRDALDGSPNAPVCSADHWEVAVSDRRASGGDA